MAFVYRDSSDDFFDKLRRGFHIVVAIAYIFMALFLYGIYKNEVVPMVHNVQNIYNNQMNSLNGILNSIDNIDSIQ